MRLLHCIAGMMMVCLVSSPVWADTNITYGSWAPSSDPFSIAMQTFAEEVGKRSDGAVSFETHFDSSVVGMRTVLAGVKDGLVDAAYIAGALYPTELPTDSTITQYATLVADPYTMSAAVTETVLLDCEECRQEVEAFDIDPLAYAATPSFYLMCREPFASLDELKGASIRAASAYLRFVKFLDATPVNTPTVEVLEVMQRGQVKCVIGSIFWLEAYSLWDVVKFIVDMPLGQYNNGLIMAMSKAVWADMPGEERKAFIDSLPTFVEAAAHNSVEKAQKVRQAAVDKGVVWAEASDAFQQAFADFIKTERAVIEQFGSEKGAKAPAEMLDALEKNLEKWRNIVATSGGDREAYKQALNENIYSKLEAR